MKIFFDKLWGDIDEKKSYLEVREDGTVLYHQVTLGEEEGEVFEMVSKGVIVV